MGLFAAAAAVLILDQGSKLAVRARVGSRPVAVGSLLAIRYVRTKRPEFFRHRSRVTLLGLWVLASICAVTLRWMGTGLQSELALWGAGAAIGGAAGNLIDVLREQAVTDFIDLGWWPVFNLADVAIVAGLIAAFAPVA